MWSTGVIDGYWFEVKHYEEGSQYRIDGGRISKLHVTKDNEEMAAYDRGWEVHPKTEEAKRIVAELVKRYN